VYVYSTLENKKMKILVTGGLGFIGSHTAVELQNVGYEVVIIDNCSNSSTDVLDGIEAITGNKPIFENFDLREKEKVQDFFSRHTDIDGVIHFAASKAVGESVENPLLYYENNIGVLVYILQELQKKDNTNFIFSSSCTIYGQADELPITENAPVKVAESPYGNTKQIGEEIIQDTCKVQPNLNAIALRYFREQLSVFGDDYPTDDGTCIRDYIHVVDLAKAHVVALQRLLNNKNTTNYEVFNVGTGTGSSVLEVIQSFESVSNQKLNYKIVDRREGDITAAYANTDKANNELGWKAVSSLDDALSSAWKWEQKVRS